MLPPGIFRVPVPTGLPVGTVNAYVLKRDPITVVDPGPKAPGAWEALKAGLSDAGVGRSEVAQILVTHGHVDHFGLAAQLREESGARVLAPAPDADMIADFHATYARRRERFQGVLAESDAPIGLRESLSAFFLHLDALGDPVPVDIPLEDGRSFEAGGELFTAIHTPGHSKGAMAYWGSRGVLLSGDTVIPGMTPLAAFGGRDGTSIGLADHLASLDRLVGLPFRLILPGHRQPLTDLRKYAWESRTLYAERQRQILALLREPRTAWQVTHALFGDLPVTEVFLGLTETLGHLEILETASSVSSAVEGGVRRFSVR